MIDNRSDHSFRSTRLKGYNYNQPGAYFVTIVTRRRECLFGEVVDGEINLNQCVKIAEWEWEKLAKFPSVDIDKFVVMPNHIHGIIIINELEGPTLIDPSDRNKIAERFAPAYPKGPARGSLGVIIGQYKSRITRRIKRMDEVSEGSIW